MPARLGQFLVKIMQKISLVFLTFPAVPQKLQTGINYVFDLIPGLPYFTLGVGCGPRGCRFKSGHSPHNNSLIDTAQTILIRNYPGLFLLFYATNQEGPAWQRNVPTYDRRQ
jgi:hypothetical protein